MEQEYNYIFKIILIGDSGVGKTSLMNRYTENTYENSNLATIGVDFKFKTLKLDSNTVKLQIWDTAGQERYKAVASNFYRGAHGIFIVFDLLNKGSFEHLKNWIDELKKKVNIKASNIVILGNKVDEKDKICVSKDDIDNFIKENGLSSDNYHEVSAKNDICVEDSFIGLTKILIEKNGINNTNQLKKKVFKIEKIQNKWCC